MERDVILMRRKISSAQTNASQTQNAKDRDHVLLLDGAEEKLFVEFIQQKHHAWLLRAKIRSASPITSAEEREYALS